MNSLKPFENPPLPVVKTNRVLGLIPARGGSKGVPRKNIRPLAGMSLLQRANSSAVESGVLDRIILSTDDPEIADHARSFGLEVPFLRPSDLAKDESPMIPVAISALTMLREKDNYVPDVLLLLQPTSPLRTPEHIRQAVGMLGDNDSVCSIIPVPKDFCPHYLMRIREDSFLDYFLPDGPSYTRRQDVPQAYKRDGTIFLTRVSVLLQQRSFYGKRCLPLFIKPEESLNIDTPEDWAEAEKKFASQKG